MKKIFTLILIAAMFGAKAQVGFGLRSGLNLSTVLGSYDRATFQFGFYGGVYAHIPVNKKWSFEPGLMYTMKGDNHNVYVNDAFGVQHLYRGNIRSNFIEVPLLASVNLSRKFNVMFGPQVSFLTSSTDYQFFNVVDLNDETPHTAFGMVAGLGYHPWKRIGFTLQCDTDINTHVERYTDVRNLVVQLGVDFRL